MNAVFSGDEHGRYSRQLMLPEIGAAGQQRLKTARVLCIGAGGLGSPAALYLAAAGIGTIGLVDNDRVDVSNLHRQILYATSDVGRDKLEAAQERIAAANPNVSVMLHREQFDAANARALVAQYDVVIDGSDNFPTRYASSDACVLERKPNVYGSVFRFDGQATVFAPHLGGPCYRCIFPEPPPAGEAPSCAEAGVLGVLPGLIGIIQATEALKILAGVGDTLVGRLLHVDALRMRFREFALRRDPLCPACGDDPTIFEPLRYENTCDDSAASIPSLTVSDVKARLASSNPPQLVDVREPHEFEIAHIEDSALLPLGELEQRRAEIAPDKDIVVLCHSGVRSAYAVQLLRQHGFDRAFNMLGGIDAWSREIDPSVPRY